MRAVLRELDTLWRSCFAAVVTVALLSCSSDSPDNTDQYRVALIVPGSIADAAWNSSAYQGLLKIKDSLGAHVSHVEATTPAAQEEALRSYAAQGFDLIIGTSFGYMDPTGTVAEEFPDTVFIHVTGQKKNDSNFGNIMGAMEEMKYLAGMVAGAKAAVQVACLACATLQGTADEAQCIVKAHLQIWGHDIVTQCLFGTIHTLGEPQHEVTPLHLLRDVDEVFDESCHW